MKQIKLMEANLLTGLAYYTADTNRRCTSDGDTCFYSPVTAEKEGKSEGCWVGKDMTPENRLKADALGIVSVCALKVQALLPDNLKVLPIDYLMMCQKFHDTDEHWDNKGLTGKGKAFLKYNIIRNFGLSEEKFSKYLDN